MPIMAAAFGRRGSALEPVAEFRETRTPECRCPYCGKILDRASATPGSPGAAPEPGDLTVCIECASPLVFDEALRVRKPWPGEVDISDPELARVIHAIRSRDRRKAR